MNRVGLTKLRKVMPKYKAGILLHKLKQNGLVRMHTKMTYENDRYSERTYFDIDEAIDAYTERIKTSPYGGRYKKHWRNTIQQLEEVKKELQ